MGNYEYVSKDEVRPYIELFEEIFRKIQKQIKKENQKSKKSNTKNFYKGSPLFIGKSCAIIVVIAKKE